MEAIIKSRILCLYWQVIESSGKEQTDCGDAIRVSVLVCTAHSILRYHVCSKSKFLENSDLPFCFTSRIWWILLGQKESSRQGQKGYA